MNEKEFATFAGGFRLDTEEGWSWGPTLLGGSFDRSSDLSEWVPAPGYPAFQPGDDMATVVSHDSDVVVVVTQDNHHDAPQTLWVIRKDDPQWRYCGCCRPDSPRGRYAFSHYEVVEEGVLASHDEYSRGTGEELFPWDAFVLGEPAE